eukprot:2069387-Amphidinium_carterae.1
MSTRRRCSNTHRALRELSALVPQMLYVIGGFDGHRGEANPMNHKSSCGGTMPNAAQSHGYWALWGESRHDHAKELSKTRSDETS